LKQLNFVFPILAVALKLSLFGCGSADCKPTSTPVIPQLLRSTLAWGTFGTGDGQFDYQHGVAVASDGIVYVSDTFNNRIQKFSLGP
jgi:hypothetical protein